MSPRIPEVENLERYFFALAKLVAQTSWLPNPEVVKKINRAVFPTIRDNRQVTKTFTNADGEVIGMYDDNVTPEWALCWTHGLHGTRPKGWTIAHIWATSDDIESYTHPANIALISEAFASLTDKNGPLTGYLQWHAWEAYGWKPKDRSLPEKPRKFEEVEWRYLEYAGDPLLLVTRELRARNNQRTQILIPIMRQRGML